MKWFFACILTVAIMANTTHKNKELNCFHMFKPNIWNRLKVFPPFLSHVIHQHVTFCRWVANTNGPQLGQQKTRQGIQYCLRSILQCVEYFFENTDIKHHCCFLIAIKFLFYMKVKTEIVCKNTQTHNLISETVATYVLQSKREFWKIS